VTVARLARPSGWAARQLRVDTGRGCPSEKHEAITASPDQIGGAGGRMVQVKRWNAL